jgi:NagD protein
METPKNYLIEMDGGLVTGSMIVPGRDKFIERLKGRSAKDLVLTNNPRYPPGDLLHRPGWIGLDIPAEHISTSALATARFLQAQRRMDWSRLVEQYRP